MTDHRIEELTAAAQPADHGGRHEKELAILATLCREGVGSAFAQDVFAPSYICGDLNFERLDLRYVAESVWRLSYGQGIPADLRLIADDLKAAGREVKDDAIAAVLDTATARDPKVAEAYLLDLVKGDKLRRGKDIVRASLDAMEAAGTDPEEVLTGTAGQLLDLSEAKGIFRPLRPVADELPGIMASLRERRTDGRDFSGLRSGFKHLDELTNGLQGLIVLAAAPSCGKTTLAKQIADNVAEVEGVPVLFFSYEQSAEELNVKTLARLAKIDNRKIMKGRADDVTEWGKVEDAARRYASGSGRNLKIIEADQTTTPERIRGMVRVEAMRTKRAPFVLIDYLQLVPATDSKGRPFPTVKDRVDAVLTELRRIAREFKTAVLVISSLNRSGYGEDGKRVAGKTGTKKIAVKPTMTNMKESGGIEYSADVILALWRDPEESETLRARYDRPAALIEGHVLKNRNGERGLVKFIFSPAWALYEDTGSEKLPDDEDVF